MRYSITLLSIVICFAACNNTEQKQDDATALAAVAYQTDYYKRFSGTIAGQPVVLHLQRNTRSYMVMSATYYYAKQGKTINLYMLPDSTVTNGYTADEDPERKGDTTQPHWQFIYDGSIIKGKWTSADKAKTYDIDLKEDYPPGSYQINVFNRQDSIPYKQAMAAPKATSSYELLRPSKDMNTEDAAFFEATIRKALGCDTLHAPTLEACLDKQVADYATEYRQMLSEDPDSTLGEAHNYYAGVSMSIVHNDDDWLIMEILNSSYIGGAHGNYSKSYLNMDMKAHKLWQMEDILRVDSVKLEALLEHEADKVLNRERSSKRSEYLLTDKVMPNGNIYITNKGITFVYDPYEIAGYVFGAIPLFIPYTSIKELLTPAFKQRMQL